MRRRMLDGTVPIAVLASVAAGAHGAFPLTQDGPELATGGTEAAADAGHLLRLGRATHGLLSKAVTRYNLQIGIHVPLVGWDVVENGKRGQRVKV